LKKPLGVRAAPRMHLEPVNSQFQHRKLRHEPVLQLESLSTGYATESTFNVVDTELEHHDVAEFIYVGIAKS
jgi:hypothetical protein